eukprot:6491606-Amphidinium_carterae.4
MTAVVMLVAVSRQRFRPVLKRLSRAHHDGSLVTVAISLMSYHTRRASQGSARNVRPRVGQPSLTIEAVLDEELGHTMQALPVSSAKALKKVLADYEENVMRYVALKDKIMRMESEITDLSAGKDPASSKPYKVPFESVYLDKPVGATMSAPEKAMLGAEGENVTIRDTRERLHYFYMSRMKKLDVAIQKEKLNDLTQKIQVDTFVAQCTQAGAAASSSTVATSLGIPLPPGLWDQEKE